MTFWIELSWIEFDFEVGFEIELIWIRFWIELGFELNWIELDEFNSIQTPPEKPVDKKGS